MKLYLVAGERSGDSRAAELMKELRKRHPEVVFLGRGGPQMRALAGDHFLDWSGEAVVLLWDVIKKYQFFRREMYAIRDHIVKERPDALISIDYPGFNLRLAQAVQKVLPDLKIVHYVSPQVWAWNRSRIRTMGAYIDLMLCIFPFEQPLYEKSGLHTIFVGHPMLDTLGAKRSPEPRETDLVGILPGSRKREIRGIFPIMLGAAKIIHAQRPGTRFEASAATPELAAMMAELIAAAGLDPAFCPIRVGEAHQLMQRATVGLVASGTATLESAYFGLPLAILYRVSWFNWMVGKAVVQVKHIGMPNILAGREIAREFLQGDARPEPVAAEMLRLLNDPGAREALQRDLAAVIAQLGEPGAGKRAAEAVCGLLEARSS